MLYAMPVMLASLPFPPFPFPPFLIPSSLPPSIGNGSFDPPQT